MISFYIQNFSLILLLPFILADQNKGFIDLLYTYIGESIAVLMTIFFIDQIKTGGRKGIFFFSVIVAIIL